MSKKYEFDVPFEYKTDYLLIISRNEDEMTCYNKSSVIGKFDLESNDDFVEMSEPIHIGQDKENNNQITGDVKVFCLAWCKRPIKGNINLEDY